VKPDFRRSRYNIIMVLRGNAGSARLRFFTHAAFSENYSFSPIEN
jgi:hypothetical protein